MQNIYSEDGLKLLEALITDSNPYPLELNVDGQPIIPKIILCNKNGDRINIIENVSNFRQAFNFESAHEITFDVNKYCNDKLCTVWDDIVDFRLIYIPYKNNKKIWYEIYITEKDDNGMVKTISGVHLNEAELSNVNLYGIEINTENDLKAHDYSPTIFYNPNDKSLSLINRLLNKMPHYEIIHVDESLMKLQRNFTFDGVSIADAFDQIAEECECLFVYGENSENGNGITRTISIYDMLDYCNDCGERGEFDDGFCTECNSYNIIERYGEDTRVFISNENLANEITHSRDADSVKNCFHLEAGDDLMTATIASCNMGSSYLWYMPEETRLMMTPELQELLIKFDADSIYYDAEYVAEIDPITMIEYNELVYKYRAYKEDIETVLDIIGYPKLVNAYYGAMDFEMTLQTSLMPSVSLDDTSAKEQCALLSTENMSPIGVKNVGNLSLSSADISVKNYAKVFVDTSKYKVDVENSSLNGYIWDGNIVLTSYSDEENDKASTHLTILFNNDLELFTRQKIDKLLSKEDEIKDSYGVVNLFKLDYAEFIYEIKRYSLDNLDLFYRCSEDIINLLIEDGHYNGDDELYEKLYIPFVNKGQAIQEEMKLKEEEIAKVTKMKNALNNLMIDISKKMSLENYLGEHWKEYISYRREDSYANQNFISDGLSNAELIKQARLFFKSALREIKKSATLQHSITTTLKNLLIISEFKSIVHYFKLGNWLRVKIDGTIYKLRLASYEIDYNNLDDISVTFTDIRDQNSLIAQIKRTFAQNKANGGNYSYTARQMTSLSYNQNVVSTSTGIVIKNFDDNLGTFGDGQIRVLSNGIYYTDNKWSTVQGVRQTIAEAQNRLDNIILESGGVFTTEEMQDDGSIIYYLHDSPELESSKSVWKMTSEAFAVSTDGGKTWNAGFTVTGEIIAKILDTIGINANWINTGALNIYKKDGTLIFHAGQDGDDEESDSTVLINADYVQLGNGMTISGALMNATTLSIVLSKEMYSVVADSSSSYTAFPDGTTVDVDVYFGQVNVTGACSYAITVTNGVDCEFDEHTHIITLKGLGNNMLNGMIEITANYLGMTAKKQFNIIGNADTYGITGIINWYAVNNDRDNPPEDNTEDVINWYTTIPEQSEQNMYLWNYEEVHYSDKTVKTTDKRVISTYLTASQVVTALLTNENESVASDENGHIDVFPDDVSTKIMVFYGTSNVTKDSLVEAIPSEGVSGVYDTENYEYIVTGLSTDTGKVTFNITYNGVTIEKVFSINKIKSGKGESALYVQIESTNGNIFKGNDIATTLICRVYYGTQEVTDRVKSFTWQKIKQDGEIDETWNRTLSGNTIYLTNADVFNRATFTCCVDIDLNGTGGSESDVDDIESISKLDNFMLDTGVLG